MTSLFSPRAICVICVICGCVLSAQSADQPQKPAQFETRADVVLVDVNVIDRDGNPVHNLSAADFALEVNGQPRAIHTLQFISTRGTDTVATPPRLEAVSRN